jgi:hypothetical protein
LRDLCSSVTFAPGHVLKFDDDDSDVLVSQHVTNGDLTVHHINTDRSVRFSGGKMYCGQLPVEQARHWSLIAQSCTANLKDRRSDNGVTNEDFREAIGAAATYFEDLEQTSLTYTAGSGSSDAKAAAAPSFPPKRPPPTLAKDSPMSIGYAPLVAILKAPPEAAGSVVIPKSMPVVPPKWTAHAAADPGNTIAALPRLLRDLPSEERTNPPAASQKAAAATSTLRTIPEVQMTLASGDGDSVYKKNDFIDVWRSSHGEEPRWCGPYRIISIDKLMNAVNYSCYGRQCHVLVSLIRPSSSQPVQK